MKWWHAGPVEPVVRLALSLAALGFLGNSIKAYREARPLVEIVRCSGFIIATLSWLLVSIFPHEPNNEFSGALAADGTRVVGMRVRWNEQLGSFHRQDK